MAAVYKTTLQPVKKTYPILTKTFILNQIHIKDRILIYFLAMRILRQHKSVKRLPHAGKTVVAALCLTGTSGQDILRGLLKCKQDFPDWNLQILQLPEMLTPTVIRSLSEEGCAGIVTTEFQHDAETLRALLNSPLPFVLMGPHDDALAARKAPTVFVCADEKKIGADGARYLLTRGKFRSYGFVQLFNGLAWSDLRAKGFEEHLRKNNLSCQRFRHANAPIAIRRSGSEADLRALERYLDNLPKPAAIMADMDFRATAILARCKALGIRIPEQLIVLGVDNDLILCEYATPPLSSIQPNHEEIGRRALLELRRLCRATKRPSCRQRQIIVHIPSLGIFERESTHPASPSANLIQRAMDFIDKHYGERLSVNDIAERLGVSRALLDLRFRQQVESSVLEVLVDRRLREVKRRLSQTHASIGQIAVQCGFPTAKNLAWQFKRRFGVTMREWRTTASS